MNHCHFFERAIFVEGTSSRATVAGRIGLETTSAGALAEDITTLEILVLVDTVGLGRVVDDALGDSGVGGVAGVSGVDNAPAIVEMTDLRLNEVFVRRQKENST